MICLHEHQNELEKLQKAALLIEKMSMGRLKVCPSTVGHVYIRPESDAYIGLQMQIAPESTPGRYAVTFTAFPRRMGLELGSSGLRRLMTEVNQSYEDYLSAPNRGNASAFITKLGSLGEDQMCKLDHALEVSVGLLPIYNTI